MRTRKLVLKREALAELPAASLRSVKGGASAGNTWCVECLNDISLEWCPTFPVETCRPTG